MTSFADVSLARVATIQLSSFNVFDVRAVIVSIIIVGSISEDSNFLTYI